MRSLAIVVRARVVAVIVAVIVAPVVVVALQPSSHSRSWSRSQWPLAISTLKTLVPVPFFR